MIVLSNRRCGKVAKGAMYMISRKSVLGTLEPFTAIAAPLPAEVASPRKPEVIDVTRTLTRLAGLVHPDAIVRRRIDWGRFAKLPQIGLADYWGQSQGYKSVWDVVEETQKLGVCRRVANVPSVPLPCPILMLHAEAVVDADRSWSFIAGWLFKRGVEWDVAYYQGEDAMGIVTMADQPWREANSLGRVGDDTYDWHPHMKLWEVISQLRERRLFKKFREECSVRFEEGVFGISWVSDFAWCLREGEDEVPGNLAVKGVIPALTENDPRAKET